MSEQKSKQNDNSNAIKVMCRFRPLNSKEQTYEYTEEQKNFFQILSQDSLKFTSSVERSTHTFTFDRIFPPTTTQLEMFNEAALGLVDSVFEGYNGTIFTYGQTSSGKTFTMTGDLESEEYKGIIPRTAEHIFNKIMEDKKNNPDNEYCIKFSMIEIYLEKIKDLLDKTKDDLQVRETPEKGIYIQHLTEVSVSDKDDIYRYIEIGNGNRTVAFTNMNAVSSRSHSLVILTIEQENKEDKSKKVGKLYLVDLAGSEKATKTGATGKTLDEGKKINASLTNLGMVINALTDPKSKHIPYRDSKLTRVLTESLGGNAKTTLIIACSPSPFNEAETLSTLRFGMRAKKIKNKAKINKEETVGELKEKIVKLEKQIHGSKIRISQLENFIKENSLNVPEIVKDKEVAIKSVPSTPSKESKGESSEAKTETGTEEKKENDKETEAEPKTEAEPEKETKVESTGSPAADSEEFKKILKEKKTLEERVHFLEAFNLQLEDENKELEEQNDELQSVKDKLEKIRQKKRDYKKQKLEIEKREEEIRKENERLQEDLTKLDESIKAKGGQTVTMSELYEKMKKFTSNLKSSDLDEERKLAESKEVLELIYSVVDFKKAFFEQKEEETSSSSFKSLAVESPEEIALIAKEESSSGDKKFTYEEKTHSRNNSRYIGYIQQLSHQIKQLQKENIRLRKTVVEKYDESMKPKVEEYLENESEKELAEAKYMLKSNSLALCKINLDVLSKKLVSKDIEINSAKEEIENLRNLLKYKDMCLFSFQKKYFTFSSTPITTFDMKHKVGMKSCDFGVLKKI